MCVCVCVCSAADCTALLIQQNDGSGFFNRPWAEYKVGFGDPSGNYWLGNDLLSQLTANNRYKLKIELQQNGTGNWYSAEYSTFRVLSEEDSYYAVHVRGFSGNASHDAFGRYHSNEKFSTFDRDNDRTSPRNCAASRGGFWYGIYCDWCLVNADRDTSDFYWRGLPGGGHLQLSRMWLKCK